MEQPILTLHQERRWPLNPEDIMRIIQRYGAGILASQLFSHFMSKKSNLDLASESLMKSLSDLTESRVSITQTATAPVLVEEPEIFEDGEVQELKAEARELSRQFLKKQKEPEPPEEDPIPIIERIIAKLRMGGTFMEIFPDFIKLSKENQKALCKNFPEQFKDQAKLMRKHLNSYISQNKA